MNDLELFSTYQKKCPSFIRSPLGEFFCRNKTSSESIFTSCRLINCPIFYWHIVLRDCKNWGENK